LLCRFFLVGGSILGARILLSNFSLLKQANFKMGSCCSSNKKQKRRGGSVGSAEGGSFDGDDQRGKTNSMQKILLVKKNIF
jgi:hypothetical protein